ncbi:hypothetical protein LIER_07186 [Lithospermum erythrorhizon]|uniref:Uncharacterized protein n=1 Tax=Lithospermum erythrorhizon TaxID=34254 RepID=A0AAV3P890_LITER
MASSCISSCVNDTRTPVRATYVNLYKWPESDAQFIRSMSYNTNKNNGRGRGPDHPRPEVVDSISCRQLYLRSYTFSKKDHKDENTKWFARIKSKKGDNHRRRRRSGGGGKGRRGGGGGRSCGRWRKVKEVTCSALVSIFRRLFFCTTKVDIVN